MRLSLRFCPSLCFCPCVSVRPSVSVPPAPCPTLSSVAQFRPRPTAAVRRGAGRGPDGTRPSGHSAVALRRERTRIKSGLGSKAASDQDRRRTGSRADSDQERTQVKIGLGSRADSDQERTRIKSGLGSRAGSAFVGLRRPPCPPAARPRRAKETARPPAAPLAGRCGERG
jgi:hypothetical protein